MAARVGHPVRAGERYVVMAWPVGGGGRKHFAGSAVFDHTGEVRASASAVWIEVAPT
jgi:hypothetical protein